MLWCVVTLVGLLMVFFFFFEHRTAYEMSYGLVGAVVCLGDGCSLVAALMFGWCSAGVRLAFGGRLVGARSVFGWCSVGARSALGLSVLHL